ncbi:MAG: CvpA family protein [Gammaproteobacteria bacterium]|nr:CvpA family protein [Gammaproteobacteria bacterium]
MDFSQLTGVDFAILSIIAVSVVTGLFRGVVKEVMALSIWVLALWIASHYSYTLAHYLKPYIQQTEIRAIAAFVAVTLLILLAGGLLNTVMSFVIVRSGLSSTDRLLGMVFGWGRGVMIIALMMMVAQMSGFSDKNYVKSSKLYPQFQPVVHWMIGFVPSWLEKIKSLDNDNTKMQLKPEVDQLISQQMKAYKQDFRA